MRPTDFVMVKKLPRLLIFDAADAACLPLAPCCRSLVRAGVCRDWRGAFALCHRARPCVRLNKRMRAALGAWAGEFPPGS